MQIRTIFPSIFAVLLPASAAFSAPDFSADVKPIIERSCIRCHGETKDNGDLRMHTAKDFWKGGVNGKPVVPGDAKKSYLIELVSLPHESGDRMPSKGDPLTPAEIKTLTDWVVAGAEFPETLHLIDRQPQKRISEAEMAKLNQLMDVGGSATVNDISAKIDELIDLENQVEKLPLATGTAAPNAAIVKAVVMWSCWHAMSRGVAPMFVAWSLFAPAASS